MKTDTNPAGVLIRYALVLIIFWIGCLKFYTYEAEGIQRLVGNSPFLSWLYSIADVKQVSALFGGTEILIALLLAIKPASPKLSIFGSLGAVLMFLTTLSFLFTTPGITVSGLGFPALTGGGQSLLKDTMLLAGAVWTFFDSKNAL
ncbi:membrane protein [Fulvitalea axinellae]|uniref:Membrane protein n=1 Tax=Fulvitalea axinellae TaxID=1182444 RepID=A0AAU9DF76_9BACT|nr:membrane protein [Fulvitalea axinellae]